MEIPQRRPHPLRPRVDATLETGSRASWELHLRGFARTEFRAEPAQGFWVKDPQTCCSSVGVLEFWEAAFRVRVIAGLL